MLKSGECSVSKPANSCFSLKKFLSSVTVILQLLLLPYYASDVRDRSVKWSEIQFITPAGAPSGVTDSRSQVSPSWPQREEEVSQQQGNSRSRPTKSLSHGLVLPEAASILAAEKIWRPHLSFKMQGSLNSPWRECSFFLLCYLNCQRLMFPTKHLCLVISLYIQAL